MKFLFDTCVVSELVRKTPDRKVVKWVGLCEEEFAFISVLTIGEIQKGITKLSDGARRNQIQAWLDNELRQRFSERILPVSSEVATTWGMLCGDSERAGIVLPSIDSLIAATAITHNLTVVTRNVSDIDRCGARTLNPWL
jgi:predicted nucleic acid-binding protein